MSPLDQVRYMAVVVAVSAAAACSAQHGGTSSSQSPQLSQSPSSTVASASQSPQLSQAATVPSAAPAQPQTLQAAIAAEQEKVDRHTSGDFAGEWLLYTKDLRDHITQESFVTYAEACASTGTKGTVSGGRMDGADRAIVRTEAGGYTESSTMVYEDGGWYELPSDSLVQKYGKSGPQLIGDAKSQGTCTKK
jgi:hypothetical protein